LALSSKYTALLLVPIFAVLAALSWRRGRDAWREGMIGLVITAVLAAIVVSITYGGPRGLPLYVKGVRGIYSDLEGKSEALLLGTWAESRWYYSLVALLLKTALPSLALIAVGVWSLLRASERRREAAFV